MYRTMQSNAVLGVIALGGLAMLAPAAAEAKGIAIRQALVATGVDRDATGQVRLDIRNQKTGLRGRLQVRARKLDGLTTLDVTVDGVRIGSFTTRRGGSGKVRFDTRPRGNDQLLGVDPRGKTAAIVNDQGAVVLQAAISNATIDPNDVRCCLPDDSGPECEDRTPAECTAAGGVDLGPGSCLPDPCLPGATTTTTLPGATTTTTLPGAVGVVRVRCERRADRSKVSVDGNDLNPGNYRARITSGANTATSGLQPTVGDEVEFEFDSEPDDIAAGATAIAVGFIQGAPPQVTGQILDAGGTVVVQATVACEDG